MSIYSKFSGYRQQCWVVLSCVIIVCAGVVSFVCVSYVCEDPVTVFDVSC